MEIGTGFEVGRSEKRGCPIIGHGRPGIGQGGVSGQRWADKPRKKVSLNFSLVQLFKTDSLITFQSGTSNITDLKKYLDLTNDYFSVCKSSKVANQ